MSEKTIDADQVRDEHLAEVHEPLHWAYMAGVMGGGFIGMLVLIALLGAG